MNDVWLILSGLTIAFCIGYDVSSYNIMRKVDNLYKTRNKWLIGYNTYMVWKTSRTVMKN